MKFPLEEQKKEKCGIQYVGQSGNTFNERFRAHLTDIRRGNVNKSVSRHFTPDNHTIDDVDVVMLTQTNGNINIRLRTEESWIQKLRSRTPKGLNLIQETDESLLLAYPGPCNVDVRDSSLTQQEFLDEYAYTKPVIIQGATDNSKFHDLCRKDNMVKKYGNKKIRLSTANTHSYEKRDVTLQHYVDKVMKPQELTTLGNETYYWFGDNNYTEWEELFNQYHPPPYRLPHMTGAYSFGVAGAGTGVPFHFHGPGFGEVIFGRKRWFLYPPDKQPSFNPNKTTLQWLYEDYNNLHPNDLPLECTINQGEVIYFPDRWWHGTLNIDTSVFISTFLG